MTTSNSFTWSAAGGAGTWSDAADWTPGGGPPGATGIAFFTGEDSSVAGTGTVGALVCEGAQTVTFTTELDVLGLSAEPYAVTVTANAEIAFGPGAILAAPSLGVGVNPGSSTLTFDQASITTTATTIGAAGSTGLVALDGGAWENKGSMLVGTGKAGIGGLSISGGGYLEIGGHGHAAGLFVGYAHGAQGAVSVEGGGDLSVSGNLVLGTGQMDVGPGGYASIGETFTIDSGSSLALAQGELGAGAFINNAGGLISGSGIFGADIITNNAEILAQGSLIVEADSISGSGSLAISSNATLVLLTTTPAANSLAFIGAHATLNLDQLASVAGTIAGFAPGDTILAPYITRLAFDSSTDVLTLYSGKTEAGTLTLAGNYAGDSFHVHASGVFGAITVSHT